MAPMWPWWLLSSPVVSESCHTPVAVLAGVSTLPRRTASQLAMVRFPWAKTWVGVEARRWARPSPEGGILKILLI